MTHPVQLTTDNAVAYVEIQRPAALNALNVEVLEGLHHCIDKIAASKDLRIVIISGAGDKAFVAGADIKAMASLKQKEALAFAQLGQSLTQKIEALPQVVVAKVQGFALGGGCELAMACDMIVASRSAKFGQPEVSLGLIPGFGGTQRLIRAVGRPLALDMLCSGRLITGDEAQQAGLVARVVDDADLTAEIERVIKGVLRGGPQAIALTKKLALHAQDWPLSEGLAQESEHFSQVFDTKESQVGMEAFLEKTTAPFVIKPNTKR